MKKLTSTEADFFFFKKKKKKKNKKFLIKKVCREIWRRSLRGLLYVWSILDFTMVNYSGTKGTLMQI